MAIEKRFIHFKKFSDFNSKKLSANEANTQYTVGISGAIQNGSPDVLYQSYVWIKDTQQQWTHGQIYNGSDVDIVFNQADWNESDETSSAYVKNRTHYASFNRIEIPETISSTTWTYIDIPDIVGYTIYVKYTFSGTVKSATLTMDDLSVEKEFNSGPQFVVTRTPSSIGIKGDYDEGHILEVSTNIAQLPEFFIPDSIARTSNIPSEVYIADFTMESLTSGMNNGVQVDCDIQALVAAMNANKIILVREGEGSDYKGVYVLNGYAEDLLYFSIINAMGNILWCEGTDYISLQYIDGSTLHLQSWDDKQDTLVSGENIKTINGESVVGSGDITIESGGGTITEVKANGTSIATSGVANIPAATTSKYGVTKLSTLTNSSSTTLAATASAVKSAYDLANGRQEKLVSGTNIKTINNTSILGSGNIAIDANIQAVDTQETLDDVNTNTYVKYIAQTLTDEQKAQVRENIGIIDNNNNYIAWDSAVFEMGNAYYMAPNKKYICTLPLTHLIFIEGTMDDTWHNNVTDLYNEYTVIFECNDTQIETPNSWIWANGSVPTLENGVRYELSISLMYINNQYLTHAVLVPFKSV